MLLSKHEIEQRIRKDGLISNYADLKEQLQPAGFDLTVEKIFKFTSQGAFDFDNKERKMSEVEEISTDLKGWWNLSKGIYKIRFNEEVKIPLDLAGTNILRSSLMRSGCLMHHGFWDPGYHGKGETAIMVANEHGIKLKKGAKVTQLIFHKLSEGAKEGYSGVHHKENVK
ncbi:MAG TPA: deoxyuridine 5'-triphosphate nucleotidohydrolase [Candidatus Norongarragalinales archaeon]|nr:deoxyuridine 5'-triphosphate nucleotidohydrolase [Candidatus Norongarragalinales archaeon]